MTTHDQKNQKNRMFHLIAILVIAGLTASAFAERPTRGRGQSDSKNPPAAQTEKAAPQRTVSRAAPHAQKNTAVTRSQPTQTRQPANNASSRSTAPAKSTPSPSVSRASTPSRSQSNSSWSRGTSGTSTQTQSRGYRSRSTVPSRPQNTTVEFVSTAKMKARPSTSSVSTTKSPQTFTPVQPTTTTRAVNSSSRQSLTTTTQASNYNRPKKSADTVTRLTSSDRPKSSVTVTRSTTTASKPVTTISRPATDRHRKSVASTTYSAAATPKTVTRTTTTTTTSPSSRTSVSKTVTTSARPTGDRHGSVGTKTVSRPAPIRVTDIKAKPDRVIIDTSRTPTRRSISPERSSVSVSLSNDNLSFSVSKDRGRPGPHRPSARQDSARIIINNNDHFRVEGRHSSHRPRPYVPRRLYTTTRCVTYDPHWYNHGNYFSFRWSNSSCGLALYLPLSSSYYSNSYYYRSYPQSSYGVSYCYPKYHRKYVFVSLGGYWPHDYRYRRYYWYGCHPHYWYGANVVQPVTYNTYNYYTSGSSMTSGLYGYSSSATPYYTLGSPKEEVLDEPQYETVADLTFAHAVDLFEAGNYEDAVRQFREAVLLSPEDVVVPFTYAQALFANGEYAKAASALRGGLELIPDDELTIYYPRGLYEDEKVLVGQIDTLQKTLAGEPFAADYQLLLGYQYLGMGQLDKAMVYLPRAAADIANRPAAEKLIALAEQLKKEADVD